MKTHTKAADWKYEEEYRFTYLIGEENPTVEDRKFYFPDGVIEEIILGLNIAEPDKREIIDTALKKQVPIFQVKKKYRAFILEKERI